MKSHIKWNPTAKQKKAMENEINRQILIQNEQFQDDFDAMLLWYIHVHYGAGKKRLRSFYEGFIEEYKKLVEYYQMPNDEGWLARYKLKEIGVDVTEWNKEIRELSERKTK